jgi:MHS family proline/betaine transporter-like MFS transporter
VPAYYLMAAGAIGVVSALFLRETAGKPLRGSSAMVESEEEAREMVARSRTHAGRRARDIWLQLRRGHLPHPHLPHRSDKSGRQDRQD